MAEQDRRDILAANRRVDALGAAGERCRLPHHEARDIEDVDAEILDDEPIALGEIGLRGIDVEPRSEGEARDEGRADPALVDHCLERADRCLPRSEEHTSELQSLMRISYAVF